MRSGVYAVILLYLQTFKDTNTIHFYRAMLCIRGTSHGAVSVSVCVCVCVCHKPVFY